MIAELEGEPAALLLDVASVAGDDGSHLSLHTHALAAGHTAVPSLYITSPAAPSRAARSSATLFASLPRMQLISVSANAAHAVARDAVERGVQRYAERLVRLQAAVP